MYLRSAQCVHFICQVPLYFSGRQISTPNLSENTCFCLSAEETVVSHTGLKKAQEPTERG